MSKLFTVEEAFKKVWRANTMQAHGVATSAPSNMKLEMKMIEINKQEHKDFAVLCEEMAKEFAPHLKGWVFLYYRVAYHNIDVRSDASRSATTSQRLL